MVYCIRNIDKYATSWLAGSYCYEREKGLAIESMNGWMDGWVDG